MPALSDEDRDMVARTILSEAGEDGPRGMAAVASVIKNRLDSGRFGSSPTSVVLQRSAFEPWSLPRRSANHPSSWSTQSPAYQRAAGIADGVWNGDIADQTNGATHFYSPTAQAALGRNPPAWGQSDPLAQIGHHVFFAPEGRVTRDNGGIAAINSAIGQQAPVPATGALAFSEDPRSPPAAPLAPAAPEPGSVLGRFGFGLDGKPAASQPAAAPPPTSPDGPEPGSVLKLFGHDIKKPAATSAAPTRGVAAPWPGFAEVPSAPIPGAALDQQERVFEGPGGIHRHMRPDGSTYDIQVNAPPSVDTGPSVVSRLGSDYATATANAFTGSREMAASGWSDIQHGNFLPTMPVLNPLTWTGGGLFKTAGGIAGQALSPLTGATTVGSQEIDKLTGMPGSGESAMALLPLPKVGRVATEMRPSAQAVNALVQDIGPQNIPGVIQRLESNPTLSVMDVAPGVQTRAIGIAKGEPSAGQTHLFDAAAQRVADRRAQTADAYSSTIGAPPNTVELLDRMKNDAREVGKTQIQPALQGAGPVDATPVIKAIDAEIGEPTITALRNRQPPPIPLSPIQQRLLRLRQDLSYRGEGGELFPVKDQYFIDPTSNPVAGAPDVGAHGIQSRLRYEASELGRSATGSDRLMAGTLGEMRGKLVDAIDQAAGGVYKPALSAYRDEMHVQEAFDKGMTITSGARVGDAGLANRPEAWAQWAQNASPREIEAAQLGARTVIDNHIGTIRQAGRAGGDIPEAPFTRAKLELLFGGPETDRLVNLLRDETAKAETNTLLTRQSVTARALAAQRETTPRTVETIGAHAQRLLPAAVMEVVQAPFTGLPGLATLGLLGYGGARKGAQIIGRSRDISRNDAYARLAAATGEDRNALIETLRQRQPAIGTGNKFSNALQTGVGLGNLAIPP